MVGSLRPSLAVRQEVVKNELAAIALAASEKSCVQSTLQGSAKLSCWWLGVVF